jgi:hypothetical protein
MHLRNALLPIAVAAALITPIVAANAQGPGGWNAANRAGGRVTAVDSGKMTVTVQGWNSSSQTFKVTDATKYQISTVGSMSDLKVGDKVRVMGQQSEDDENTVDARAIMVLPPNSPDRPNRQGDRPGGNGQNGGRRFGVTGTIATLSPKFTVTTSDNQTKTVDTTDDTRVMTSKPGSFSDIAVGKMVMAMLSNGSASRVQIMPAMPGGFGGRHNRQGNTND